MGSKGGFAIVGLLFILAVLCHSGQSLMCYQCPKNVLPCSETATCGSSYDTCMAVSAAGGQHSYFQCWKRKDCNFLNISKLLGESQLKYRCCQDDLCNKNLPGDAPVTSGMTLMLVVPLLAAAWNMCF